MLASNTASLIRPGIVLWAVCGLSAATWAAGAIASPDDGVSSAIVQDASASGPLRDFDIPVQSLAKALRRYAVLVDLPIVFSSDMVRGRNSSAVQGRYSSEEALRQLLDGTGLSAERQDSRVGTTILLKDTGKPDISRSAVAQLFGQAGYPGLVQQRIWQALCADPHTAPGRYRLLFRFQIDPAGHLADTQLLASTGDARRDAAVLDTLQRIQVAAPPPAIVQHPLTMSMLPDALATAAPCESGAP
jgi:TonB family protein